MGRLGPFTGGINRLLARTLLRPQELFDAQGVIQDERGRLKACWEAETADSSTYAPLTDGTTSVEEAPRQAMYWQKASKLCVTNNFRATVDGLAYNLVESADGDAAKNVRYIEYAQKLWAFVDKEPLRFYLDNQYTNNTLQIGTNPSTALEPLASQFHTWYQVKGMPFWAYHSYWESKDTAIVADTDATLEEYTGMTGVSAACGSGATPENYTANMHIYKGNGVPDPKQYLYSHIGFYSNSTSTTIMFAMSGVAENVTDKYVRIGHCSQQFMGRYPATYKNRLCCIEGRQYEYSKLDGGLTSHVKYVSANRVDAFNVDLTSSDQVRVGDELILYHDGTNISKILDYAVTGDNDDRVFQDGGGTRALTVTDVYATGGDTAIIVNEDLSTGDDISSITTYIIPFVVRRTLTNEQRRTLWFSGRQADAANGIALDITDAAAWGARNNVVIGTDVDGDITGLFAQGDGRLIVGLESGLYEVVGNLPIDGVAPPGFDVRLISGSVGVRSDTSGAFDDTGNIFYFASGTDYGMYMLYGQTVERIDEQIREHPQHPANASTPACFSHVNFVNKRLYCLTDESDPYIWVLDTTARSESSPYGAWTYTKRVNSGQGQQQSDGAALELSDTSPNYAVNKLYNGTGDHGGIFSPYRSVGDIADQLFVVFSDGTDYKLRTMNHGPSEHNEANLLHGVKVQTGYVDGGTQAPKRIRQIRVLNTKPLVDDNAGAAFTEAKVAATTSEGETTLSRDVTPDWSDSQGDSNKYRVQGTGGRGDTSVSVTVNDGISPMGEIDSIEIDLIPMEYRNR